MAEANPVTLNILCLDGGGVRGLSTLVILKRLLCLVNVEIHGGDKEYEDKPADITNVFDVVVGTSTGGLIALMLVKMAMDVNECIVAYRKLSEQIFSKWHYIGVLKGGFGRVKKYCGKNLRRVVVDSVIVPHLDSRSNHPEKYEMEDDYNHINLECSVVCNELTEDMDRTGDAIFLCSKRCRRRNKQTGTYDRVRVADAARATSAAPTYFSQVVLLDKILVDGGFGRTNNPSLAAMQHYVLSEGWHLRDQQDRWQSRNLKYQMINIGTGSHPGAKRGRKSLTHLVSSTLRDVSKTLKNLQNIATEADTVGKDMDFMVPDSQKLTYFRRFSADRGNIHTIGLDAYKRINEIENLTNQYLLDEAVNARLKEAAVRLAQVYNDRKRSNSVSVQPLFERQASAQPDGRARAAPPIQSNHNQNQTSVAQLPASPDTDVPSSDSGSPVNDMPTLDKLALEDSVPSLSQTGIRHAETA